MDGIGSGVLFTVNWGGSCNRAFFVIRLSPADSGRYGKVKQIAVDGCQIAAIILPAEHGIAEQLMCTGEFFEPTCPP